MDEKKIKLVKIDEKIHKEVKKEVADLGISIKSFIEELITDYFYDKQNNEFIENEIEK